MGVLIGTGGHSPRMELFLNLASFSVALGIVCVWLCHSPHEGFSRKTQMVALALLLLILFPVISVTDDLRTVDNPAETDSCVRRDHLLHGVQPAPQFMAFFQPPLLVGRRLDITGFADIGSNRLPVPSLPAMAPIENRPPPTA